MGGEPPPLRLTKAQLYSTRSYRERDLHGIGLGGSDLTEWDLSRQNLTNASLAGSTLTNVDLSEAVVTGAEFFNTTSRGFSQDQLASTASYRARDLQGIGLGRNDLTGWDLSGQILTDASFRSSILAQTNFSESVIAGADFTATGCTAEQLYSTASYKSKDLRGVIFEHIDLDAWDLRDQNLTHARFQLSDLTDTQLSGANLTNADLRGSTLTHADLSGADLRGALGPDLTNAIVHNTIHRYGAISALELAGDARLVVRDDDGVPYRQNSWIEPRLPIAITIEDRMSMSDEGALRLLLESDPWDSLISFEPGIPVQLGGTLELTFAKNVDAAAQVGRTLDLFNWSGVSPTGAFAVASLDDWDLSRLYTTGEVTLLAAAGTIAGDANGDGKVDTADFGFLKDHFGLAGARAEGDADGNGRIDLSDFGLLKLNLGKSIGNVAVPEPGGLALAAIGLLVLAALINLHGARRRWARQLD